MQKKNFFEYVFDELEKDEREIREELLLTVMLDNTIIYDYNILSIINDHKKMNDEQYKNLELLKKQFHDSNVSVEELKENIAIIADNNILERLHSSTIQLLSIARKWDDSNFKTLKYVIKPVLDYFDSDPKNCDEFLLDLIMKNQEHFKEFEENEKKLIKKGVKNE